METPLVARISSGARLHRDVVEERGLLHVVPAVRHVAARSLD